MQHLTSLLPSSRVAIDCSRMFLDSHLGTQPALAELIEWVKRYPDRAGIDVYVGAGKNRSESRKLQNAMQVLGCRVIARHRA